MRVIYGIGRLEPHAGCPKAVTVGVFDGVHRGHRRVLARVCAAARKNRWVSAVVTFAAHPSRTLRVLRAGCAGRAGRSVRHLTSLTHKLLLLQRAGIDECYVLPFDRAMARRSPEAFVRDILVERLRAAAVYVGEDFVFGRKASGNVATLRAAARKFGFRFFALRHVKTAGRVISSTRLRALIEHGDLVEARRLLGRRVSLLGCVVRGEGRGKRLGFPTANIAVAHEALVPDGVYATRARCPVGHAAGGLRDVRGRPCVTYVGRRPTFHSRRAPRVVEVHFWRPVSRRLRGCLLEVEFVRRLRPDRRFKRTQDLIDQMRCDIRLAKRILKRFS